MKKLILGLAVLALLGWVALPCRTQVFAQSGCCKVRQSERHPWRANGMSFQDCKQLNQREGDNILKKSGLVWWDAAC